MENLLLRVEYPICSKLYDNKTINQKSESHDILRSVKLSSSRVAVQCRVRTRMPTRHGDFYCHLFVSDQDPGKEHIAYVYDRRWDTSRENFTNTDLPYLRSKSLTEFSSIVSNGHYCDSPVYPTPARDDINDSKVPILTRIHSECFTSEVLGSCRCDCAHQLDAALSQIVQEGQGVLLYLRQEGRGIGLENKLRAYNLQDQGLDTLDANRALGLADDARDYGIAVAILHDLGVQRVRLMTNNPLKIAALQEMIAERVPLIVAQGPLANAYLITKSKRMSHILH